MFRVNVDRGLLAERFDLAGATEQQIDASRLSALRKMRQRISTRIKRLAAKKLRIPQKAIADRFFSSAVAPGDEELTVWIGSWAVSPYSIGQPSQMLRGVKVGRRSYPGAFLARIYSQKEQVWIRLRSKRFSPDLYPTKYRPGDRGQGGSSHRFPVVRAAIEVDEVMRQVIEKDGAAIGADFEQVFLQELNYQVNVKGVA